MAISASIALSAATCTAPNGAVVATVTITNNNATDAIVLGVDPIVEQTGTTNRAVAASVGMPPMGPGQTNTVTASGGTLKKSWAIQPFSPQQGGPTPGNPASQVFDCGCIIYTNATGADAVVQPSTTTLTVSAPTH